MTHATAKFGAICADVFSVEPGSITDDLAYNSIQAWDSVGHMMLMSALENEYGIMLETEDIIDFSTIGKGKEILEKYGVHFSD